MNFKVIFLILSLTQLYHFEIMSSNSIPIRVAKRTGITVTDGSSEAITAAVAINLGWACPDCAAACSQRGYQYYCANPPNNCCECTNQTKCVYCQNIC